MTVTDLLSTSSAGEDVPAVGDLAWNAASAGNDGGMPTEIQYMANPSNGTGLYAFDTVHLRLTACPRITSPGVVAACLSYCEGQRGHDVCGRAAARPGPGGHQDLCQHVPRAQGIWRAVRAMDYQIVNPLDTTGANPRLWIPPVGHILGAYARIAEHTAACGKPPPVTRPIYRARWTWSST